MALPLCSSDQVASALSRAGFQPKGRNRGSHQTFVRAVADGTLVVVVPMGKREIPRGTLRSILKQAGLSEQQFRAFLR